MTKIIQVIALGSLLAAASCGKKDTPDPVQPPAQVAHAMFMNACIGAAPLKVNLNEVSISSITSLNTLDKTAYLELAPATQVKTAFVTQSSNVELAKTMQDYTVNTYYSVFATGLVNNPSVLVTTDDISAPAGNLAKVRFINLSPDNLSETVYVGSNKIDSNVDYKEATGFRSITAGTYNVIVQDPNNVPLSQNLQSQQFTSGKVYTLILTGTQNGSNEAALKLSIINNN